jgi:hypothetical protein
MTNLRRSQMQTLPAALFRRYGFRIVLGTMCMPRMLQARCVLRYINPSTCHAAGQVDCVILQAIGQAGSSFVKFFASIDRKAEDAGVFPKLTPSPVPEEVVGSDGSVDNSVEDVRQLLMFHTQTHNITLDPPLSDN